MTLLMDDGVSIAGRKRAPEKQNHFMQKERKGIRKAEDFRFLERKEDIGAKEQRTRGNGFFLTRKRRNPEVFGRSLAGDRGCGREGDFVPDRGRERERGGGERNEEGIGEMGGEKRCGVFKRFESRSPNGNMTVGGRGRASLDVTFSDSWKDFLNKN